jgi:membrane protease YdiL (CAAX protease family)
MGAQVSPPRAAPESHSRFRCWLESVVLALGVPAAIWCVSNLIKLSIPAALHGSPEQCYLLWIAGGAIVEWMFVFGVALALRGRGLSFKDLGVWRVGTWPAWAVALGFAALSIGSNLRFLSRMQVPISYAFFPHGLHLVAALITGITAGFCEEVLFRAFLMTEFARAGYGTVMQVIMPGLAFGLSHAGYLNDGFLPWLGIMLPTAFLGMMWGLAYLLGRRSLVPVIVAHFLNDATALQWITFFMVTGSTGTK